MHLVIVLLFHCALPEWTYIFPASICIARVCELIVRNMSLRSFCIEWNGMETAIGLRRSEYGAYKINVARPIVAILFADNILIRCLFGLHCFPKSPSKPLNKKKNVLQFFFSAAVALVSSQFRSMTLSRVRANVIFEPVVRCRTFRLIITKNYNRFVCMPCSRPTTGADSFYIEPVRGKRTRMLMANGGRRFLHDRTALQHIVRRMGRMVDHEAQ